MAKIKTQEGNHSSHIDTLRSKLGANNQYVRHDALIPCVPRVPDVSDLGDCEQIVRGLLREHSWLNVGTADISIVHRIGLKLNSRDKRHILFKLCRRDLVGDIFKTCKATKPPFYINTS